MVTFETLFGISPSEIQKTCIIAPFLTKGLTEDLRISSLQKGKPFSTGQGPSFSFIYSQIGSPLVGDAVLHLKDTPCQHVILLGACGLIRPVSHLGLGSIVTLDKSLNLESFSKLLKKDINNLDWHYAHQNLLDRFISYVGPDNITRINGATLGSIKLEENFVDFFIQNKIDCVDMESSAFFSAAFHIQRKAIAVLYISDIFHAYNVFEPVSMEYLEKMRESQRILCRMVSDFSKSLTNFTPEDKSKI